MMSRINMANLDSTPKRIGRRVGGVGPYTNKHESSKIGEIENEDDIDVFDQIASDVDDAVVHQEDNHQELSSSLLESRFYTTTAFELLQRVKSRIPITTFSTSLDQLLGQ